jgi:L-xylulokinase
MERYVIAVDNGGTAIKAGLYDGEGRQVALAREASVATSSGAGRVEIDLDDLWAANARCIRAVIAEAGVEPEQIVSVGFAGQGKGLYAVDAEGRQVRRAITSADDRARDHADRWNRDGTAEAVGRITLQGVFSSHPTALLAWLRDAEPEAYARIRWVFSMKDYLVMRATGRAVSDPSNQSGNSFMNLRTRDYDPEILRLLGIPEIIGKLPPLVEATDVVGPVTDEAREAWGCGPATSVIAGLFDVNATALAAGVIDDGTLCMITGTAGVNVYASPTPVTGGAVAMNSYYCVPGYFIVEEGSNSSVGTLEWVIEALFADRVMKDERYAVLEAEASSVAPDASDTVFLPYFSGDAGSGRAKGTWIGMVPSDRRPHLVRAAYEGIAFAHRRHVDRMLAATGGAPRLRIAGGGVNSALFLQTLADTFQQPIEVTEDAELGLRGIAAAALVATGILPELQAAVGAATRIVEPEPAVASVYARKYARFTAALDALASLWEPTT